MKVHERPDGYVAAPPAADHLTQQPFHVFEAKSQSLLPTALVILNTSLQGIDVKALWQYCGVRVCADGGANRLYSCFSAEDRALYVPDFITGDCDSLSQDVEDYYRRHGTTIIRQNSQYSTDFMKSLSVAAAYYLPLRNRLFEPIDAEIGTEGLDENYESLTVYVAGGVGGRFDQTCHLISQLFSVREKYQGFKMYIVTESDVLFLVPKGTSHVTYGNHGSFFRGDGSPKCGIMPFKGKTVLNTDGLRYDVEDWPSEMGANVSTSNEVCGVDGFVVESTEDVVMSIEIQR